MTRIHVRSGVRDQPEETPKEGMPDNLPLHASSRDRRGRKSNGKSLGLKTIVVFGLGFSKTLIAVPAMGLVATPQQFLVGGIVVGFFDMFTFLAAALGIQNGRRKNGG